jgi:hypothetical protein
VWIREAQGHAAPAYSRSPRPFLLPRSKEFLCIWACKDFLFVGLYINKRKTNYLELV